MLLPMTLPTWGLPRSIPSSPRTALRPVSGIQLVYGTDPGFLRLKFTKDTCRDADAVPGSWALSPWSRRKSVSFQHGGAGSLSEGSSLPGFSVRSFPAPIVGAVRLPCTPSTSSWPAAGGGDPEQEHSPLHLQEPAKRL